jgi:lipopolysaccharide assembly protein B
MYELLLLLLPVAAASGWYAARRSGTGFRNDAPPSALRSDYFKGISYLLNEQPDKAIEVFIKVLEVDSETAETHLALGNLYRRRGEVDRAIRIHQNLIARQNIDADQRNEALLELGQDYMSAGLLDRAENIFQELVDTNVYRVQALRQLIDIFEQEKDWSNAIHASRRLEEITGNQLGGVMAHYHCEEVERLRQGAETEKALEGVRNALDCHASCVRASLLEGDILQEVGATVRAVEAYRRVEQQDPELIPETIDRLKECYSKLGRTDQLIEYLSHVLDIQESITAMLALAELVRLEQGDQKALEFVTAQLMRRASVRGLHKLVELQLYNAEGQARDHYSILESLTTELLSGRPVYQCRHCGFPAKSLHWQCPGCKHWNTIKPIQGVEGE